MGTDSHHFWQYNFKFNRTSHQSWKQESNTWNQTAISVHFEGISCKIGSQKTGLYQITEIYLYVHNLYSARLPNQYPKGDIFWKWPIL